MVLKYLINYVSIVHDDQSSYRGRCEITRNGPIKGLADIQDIEASIAAGKPRKELVLVIGFKRFESDDEQDRNFHLHLTGPCNVAKVGDVMQISSGEKDDSDFAQQVEEATQKIMDYDVNGTWYECHTIDEMQQFYMSRLPVIRSAAKACGYAIGLHGSCRRDFDLMAMQWTDECVTPDELAHAIAKAACGITRCGPYQWEKKPRGRIATSFTICWTDHSENFPEGMLSLGHIDLSIIAGDRTVEKLFAVPTNKE